MLMKSVVYDTAGTYTFTPGLNGIPSNVEVVWADIWGGGGGGFGTQSVGSAGNCGGGGGAPEFVEKKKIPIIGGSLTIVVGAKGAHGIDGVHQPTKGGDSSVANSVLTTYALGGTVHIHTLTTLYNVYSQYNGGSGGGPRGSQTTGGLFAGTWPAGGRESPFHTGGNAGGNGGSRTSVSAAPKHGTGAYSDAVSHDGAGGGGASTQWGPGGEGATLNIVGIAHAGQPGIAPGSGGGGAGSDSGTGNIGGDGVAGKVIIYYLE